MSAKLTVPLGTSVQFSSGETAAGWAEQVNLTGIGLLSVKAGGGSPTRLLCGRYPDTSKQEECQSHEQPSDCSSHCLFLLFARRAASAYNGCAGMSMKSPG